MTHVASGARSAGRGQFNTAIPAWPRPGREPFPALVAELTSTMLDWIAAAAGPGLAPLAATDRPRSKPAKRHHRP